MAMTLFWHIVTIWKFKLTTRKSIIQLHTYQYEKMEPDSHHWVNLWLVESSVVDPFHFDVDPDPDPWIHIWV